MGNISSFVNYINGIVPSQNYSRLGTVFETSSNKYLYDAGTGKVFSCSEEEYKIFKYILVNNTMENIQMLLHSENISLDVLDNIIKFVEAENILRMPLYDHFEPNSKQAIEQKVNEEFRQLILELTQNCNLRCGYCIYNDCDEEFRNFSSKNMEWDTAKKAIDYAFEHAGDEIGITFYGGEPLLNFDLLKKCIEYSKSKDDNTTEVSFSFTTNLTLMTKERAEYFANLGNCSILGSLDGPKDIHDLFRKTKDSEGSYDKAIEGLRNLITAYGENAEEKISVNAVLAPPYSAELFERVNNYFKDTDWFPDRMKVRCSYMDPGSYHVAFPDGIPSVDKNELRETVSLSGWAITNMQKSNMSQMQKAIVDNTLLKVQKRIISNQPIAFMGRNGCCIPGQRRLYVTTEGEYKVCERIGKSPSIGNVDDGINFNNLYEDYIDSYQKKAVEQCSNCWCVHLCNMCYANYCNEDRIDFDKKFDSCMSEREACRENLISYHTIMEANPELLKYLNDIQLI